MFAADAQAFLRVGAAARFGVAGAQDDVLPLVHAGVGKHQRGVVLDDHRCRGHDGVAFRLEKLLVRVADFVGCHVCVRVLIVVCLVASPPSGRSGRCGDKVTKNAPNGSAAAPSFAWVARRRKRITVLPGRNTIERLCRRHPGDTASLAIFKGKLPNPSARRCGAGGCSTRRTTGRRPASGRR